MKTSKFTDEQITMALHQFEAGNPVSEVCRKLGVSEQKFYRWKKRFGSLGVPELLELRQLRDENRKLKGLVADPSLDKTILQEAKSSTSKRSSFWGQVPRAAPKCTGRGWLRFQRRRSRPPQRGWRRPNTRFAGCSR